MAMSFAARYPNLTAWVQEHEGWIEIGRDEYSGSLIRLLDSGGMLWESEKEYASIDDALAEAEQALIEHGL